MRKFDNLLRGLVSNAGGRRAPGETVNGLRERRGMVPLSCHHGHLRSGHGPYGMRCVVCGEYTNQSGEENGS